MTAPAEPAQQWQAADWVVCAVVTGTALVLFTTLLAKGLLPGDSGEFQTIAWSLGHAHPSGYSLYLWLAHAFTRLPWQTVAWRVNWLSAVMATLTVGMAYGYGYWLTGRRAAAVTGAVTLALGHTFWSQALIAEVYTTSGAALLGSLWLLNRWQRSAQARHLVAAAFLAGCAPGLHLSGLFWVPAAIVALLLAWHRRETSLKKSAAALLAGLIIGLLAAAIAFWGIDQDRPPTDYFATVIIPARSAYGLSEMDLADTWGRLRFAWSGTQFQFRLADSPLGRLPGAAWSFLSGLRREIPWPMLPLLPLGAIWLWRRHRPVALTLFTFLGLHWLYAANYDVWDQYVFYLPDYLVLSLILAAGVAAAADWSAGWTSRWRAAFLFAWLPLLILWQVPGPLAARQAGAIPFNFPAYAISPYSQERLAPALAQTTAALPRNSLVFSQWSELYPFYYAAQISGSRPDLDFIQIFQTPGTGAIPASQLDWLRAEAARRPVFLALPLLEMVPDGWYLRERRIGAHDLWQVSQP